eukprot:CAMPEP_0197918462 /NCGR_PEP_ID=MMETSP1439-20131203/85479_1 /TAXON_ID=66791 /ORGANISM="Gonyaulax spinifera, Strain CCMP409" /LENGTH=52 /DNA_ID=CAMNT_0043540581 /DNA_START=30 /DNA_END=185 /DNA_ORIENTATION=+
MLAAVGRNLQEQAATPAASLCTLASVAPAGAQPANGSRPWDAGSSWWDAGCT